MKLTKKYLEQLIKEECGAMMPVDDAEESEVVGDPEHEETDIEGLAHRAIAAIYDLATAAGVDISISAGSGNGHEGTHDEQPVEE